MKNSNVRFLVMGGQACVLYGAAEFSRDLDLAIGIDPVNVESLQNALEELKADVIYVPDLDVEALGRGHACHFRCHAAGTEGLRIDLMARMRGCPDFDTLWNRRTVVGLPDIGQLGLLSLPDLVRAKKTQREKDWPMIRRLVEVDHLQNGDAPTRLQTEFWLLECRTPSLIVRLAGENPDLAEALAVRRPLLRAALQGETATLESLLLEEEQAERAADREYWSPLRKELERWRRRA